MRVTVGLLVLAALHLAVLVSTTLAQSCGNGDLRLRGTGSTRLQGRMEVCYNNEWGTVCHSGFGGAGGSQEAMVACRQLGFSELQGTQITISSDPFGEGTGPIHLDVVRCVGDERALIDCPRNDIGVLSSACATDHTEDAGVMCASLDDCTEGTVQLVNGSTSDTGIEGRVEVCANQTWSTVLGSNWGDEEAMVVCRELGYSDLGATAVSGGLFGMGIGLILDIQCTGNETSLDSCTVSSNDRNYDHSNDAGVICLSNTQFVSNLCTNESIFDSECKMFRTDTITTTPGSTQSVTDFPFLVIDNSLPAVLGALLGIVLIGIIIGVVITCIIMRMRSNSTKDKLTKNTGSIDEFKNPAYGVTAANRPRNEQIQNNPAYGVTATNRNQQSQEAEGLTYEVVQ